MGNHLHHAGVAHVQHVQVNIPIGSWGGAGGRLMATDAESGARALKGPIVGMRLTTEDSFEMNLKQMIQDMERIHSYHPFYVAFGQK